MLQLSFITALYIGAVAATDSIVVETDVGTFRGNFRILDVFGEQHRVKRFLGVPYAEPPIEKRRFTKPEAKGKIDEPYDATKLKPSCLPILIDLGGKRNPDKKLDFSEDCLYLNIYTPEMPNNELVPVLIWFHGGGFMSGSPAIYTSEPLVAYRKVVMVTVAYRLSVWGFLSTGDENLPGNYGLWDQHLAIKWVHANIAKFGGNPELITLAGNSAGSVSAIVQSLFPGNSGLFKRVIGHSGSITCPWAFNPNPLKTARRFAGHLGCDSMGSTKVLADCIKSKSTEEMYKVTNDINNEYIRWPLELVTVVDGEFMPETPNSLFHGASQAAQEYRNGFLGADFMTGVTAGEGLVLVSPLKGVHDVDGFEVDRSRFENELIPEALRIMFGNDVPDIAKDILISEYTYWSNPNDAVLARQAFVDLNSDYVFNIQAVEAADIHAKYSKHKTYLFHHDAFPSQHLFAVPSWSNKPNHGDELPFVLGYDPEDGFVSWTHPYSPELPDEWELELSKTVMTLWSNFMISGNPNSPEKVPHLTTEWPLYDIQSQTYLNISRGMSEQPITGNRLLARRVNLWHNLLPKVVADARKTRTPKTDYSDGFCERDGDCKP